MDFFVLAARVILAVTFLVSGAAKLVAPDTAENFRGFGLPSRLAAPAALIVPTTEVITALLLIPQATVIAGGWLSAALLATFTTGLALNMARGRSPDCRCFGGIAVGRVGWPPLLRNVALLAFAVAIGVGGAGQPGLALVPAALASGDPLVIASGALNVVTLTVIVAGLWWLRTFRSTALARLRELERRVDHGNAQAPRRARARTPRSPRGRFAPELTATDLAERRVPVIPDGETTPTLLVFTDPACKPCDLLMPDVARWQQELDRQVTVKVITRGSPGQNRRLSHEYGLRHVLLQHAFEIADAFEARGTPAAVVVEPSRRVVSDVVVGSSAIRTLVRDLGLSQRQASDRPLP